MCTIIIVKCSWDGLPKGRNCFCVWSFWCSELCSVDQMVTVQRGSVDVRGPEWFCQPFCSLWISTVPREWGGLYQWFAQQSGLPSVVFCGQIGSWAEPDSYWCADSMMAELNCFSSSCGRLNFLSWRRKYSLCWAFFYNVVWCRWCPVI